MIYLLIAITILEAIGYIAMTFSKEANRTIMRKTLAPYTDFDTDFCRDFMIANAGIYNQMLFFSRGASFYATLLSVGSFACFIIGGLYWFIKGFSFVIIIAFAVGLIALLSDTISFYSINQNSDTFYQGLSHRYQQYAKSKSPNGFFYIPMDPYSTDKACRRVINNIQEDMFTNMK